jgi:nicotinamide riboside kinase
MPWCLLSLFVTLVAGYGVVLGVDANGVAMLVQRIAIVVQSTRQWEPYLRRTYERSLFDFGNRVTN